MAAFYVILLSFVILQTALLEESFVREIPDSGCDCQITKSWCEHHYETRIEVRCSDITTQAKVRCAHQRLKDVTAQESFKELRFDLRYSNLGLFQPDFFENLPVTEIYFYKCNITEIPRSLIASACGTLANLRITGNDGLKSMGEKAFDQCPSLLNLDLSFNKIENMSPRAFYGLSNLEKLGLLFNKLTSFGSLEGIPKLSDLILEDNDIEYIDRNAFQNLSNLRTIVLRYNKLHTLEEGIFDLITNSQLDINLAGNPLNCDCSLKWLQDWWSSNRISDLEWSRPACSPNAELLRDIDLSHCPSATTFQKQAFDREISTLNRDSEWRCLINDRVYYDHFTYDGASRIQLQCSTWNSDHKVNLQRVKEYLQKVDTGDSNNVDLRVFLDSSDLGLFPVNFLAPYQVTSLEFHADITQFPAALVSTVCDTLIRLVINETYATGLKRIGEKVLANCSLLKDLDLSYNAIEDVSSVAFYGLTSLFRLDLAFNKLTNFNELEGIPQLEELDLSHNALRYIAKNAFQNLKKLRLINVNFNSLTTLEVGIFDPLTSSRFLVKFYGNYYLDCTNSAKWLQDSSKQHHANVDVNCYSGIYRWDLNLTNVTPAKSNSKDDNATGQASRDSVTGIADFVSFLIFMLFKIT